MKSLSGIWSVAVATLAFAGSAGAGDLRQTHEMPQAGTLSAPAAKDFPPAPGTETCAQVQDQVRAYQADRAELDRTLLNNHRTVANWMYGWDADLWRVHGYVLRYNGSIGSAANNVANVITSIEAEQQRLAALFQSVANCVGMQNTPTEPLPEATGQPHPLPTFPN